MISLIFSVGGLVCVNRKVKCTGEVGKKEGIRRESCVGNMSWNFTIFFL